MHRRQNEEFLLRKAGLSNNDILRSATVHAASYLGVGGSLGQIEDGYTADLLVLISNPLQDIGILAKPEENIVAIMKDGRIAVSNSQSFEVAQMYQ
jgi:imidazolonepropionase-like amidohydrolase